MHIDGDALVLETRLGPVRMPAPLSWEEGPSGEKSLITCRYVSCGADRFGFEVTGRKQGWALTVDPGLVWSTFLGGTGDEYADALALDAQGAVTVAGRTYSADFPVTPGAFDTTYNGNFDAYVTRLASSGSTLVFSTFLGASGDDRALAVAVDAQGAVTVAGSTQSTNFPTTAGAFDTTHNGGGTDGFVSRLSATGASLLFSTFFGGMYSDAIDAIALDAQGAVTIAGSTGSPNLPTTPGAFDTTHNGGFDVFVARVSPTSASLVYSTFLGGTVNDGVEDLALDAQGAATVTGWTRSADFPTTIGAFDTTFNGGIADAFVTQISPTGSSAVFSTFLGGTLDETAKTLALDTQGAVTVAGYTTSADFPTTPGAFDTTYSAGNNDGFVTRLSPTGASLVWSTFLGGTGGDDVYALALDPTGGTIVAGITISSDFPTTAGCFDPTWNGGAGDGFMAHLSPKGSDLRYSTYLGGTSEDYVRGLTLDALGTVTVAGVTNSPDFPTTPGAFDTTYANGTFAPYDAFITRLDLLPTGVTAFGRSSPGCTGPLAISVTSMPRVGNAGFALTCGNAPPNTSGLLALTGGRFATPVVVLGAEIWVDPTLVFLQIPATGNSIGASEVSLPIPNGRWLRGTRLFAQFFWAGPTSPPPCPPQGLSASHGLEFTVQP